MQHLQQSAPVRQRLIKQRLAAAVLQGIACMGVAAPLLLASAQVQAAQQQLDFNIHTNAHLYRASQEGIAFAFRYGLDIMRENKMNPSIIRAGKANMFLSDVFTECFVNILEVSIKSGNHLYAQTIGQYSICQIQYVRYSR